MKGQGDDGRSGPEDRGNWPAGHRGAGRLAASHAALAGGIHLWDRRAGRPGVVRGEPPLRLYCVRRPAELPVRRPGDPVAVRAERGFSPPAGGD